jgi:DNA-binding LacI/PurR family transcriptional regulator
MYEDRIRGGPVTTSRRRASFGDPREPDKRSPQMADVARVAGVSTQTVSRVLRAHPHVSERARTRVLAAVEALGYRKNSSASSLASARSLALGAVMLDVGSYRFAVAGGVMAEAKAAGLTVNVGVTPSLRPDDIATAASGLLDQSVAGLVLLMPLHETNERLDKILGVVPSIAIGGGPPEWSRAIAVDERVGSRIAVEHLLNLGHETVWFVDGPSVPERRSGWRDALERANRPTPPPVLMSDWSPESGYEAGRQLLSAGAVTAVAVTADEMAIGVMRALQDGGLNIPNDVAVVGFDDLTIAPFAAPALSSIRQPYSEIGARAVRYLLHRIHAEEGSFESPALVPELVIRASSGSQR